MVSLNLAQLKVERRRCCGGVGVGGARPWYILACFWLLGLNNNSPYVIALALAPEIASGGVGLVYLAAITPTIAVKSTVSLWYHATGPSTRMALVAALMSAAYALIAFGNTLSAQLAGVALVALQGGLGEATVLALCARYPPADASLTAWSSGTGFAGVFGYFWVAALRVWLGLSMRATLLLANVTAAMWLAAYFFGLLRAGDGGGGGGGGAGGGGGGGARESGASGAGSGGGAVVYDRIATSAAAIAPTAGARAKAKASDSPPRHDAGSPRAAAARAAKGAGGGAAAVADDPEAPAAQRRARGGGGAGGGATAGSPRVAAAAAAGGSSGGSGGGGGGGGDAGEGDESDPIDPRAMTWKQRFAATLRLWPYTVPLFVVYFAEYTMMSGVWSAIGFPVESAAARKTFYLWANWSYQIAVFISRSSGTLLPVGRRGLWAMPVLQCVLLAFFAGNAAAHWWYNWGLMVLCFAAGLLGGATYVNAFVLVTKEVAPSLREFSLAAACVADSLGIAAADGVAVLLQGCLLRANALASEAVFKCGAPGGGGGGGHGR